MATRAPRIAFYQRKRFLLLCACGLTLYHHRQRISQLLQRAYATTTGALTAAETATSTLAQASDDLHTYLHTPASSSQPVPHSLRRLLRMLASPEGLVMLRSAAAGAAGVAIKELSKGKGKGKAAQNQGWMDEVVKVGLSTGGSRLIAMVIKEAVREVTSTVMEFQNALKKDDERQPLEVILDGLLTEKGERLIVHTAKEVTKTAVPLIMQGLKTENKGSSYGMNSMMNGYTGANAGVTTKKRPSSARYSYNILGRSPSKAGHFVEGSGGIPTSPSTPRSKRMLATALALSGHKSWLEKLMFLASRDPKFVHGVLRTVASEAIRTYLTTQAELKLGRRKKTIVADPLAKKCICSTKDEKKLQEVESNYVVLSKSLWKVLVKSVVTDCKDAFARLLENPPEPQWIFL